MFHEKKEIDDGKYLTLKDCIEENKKETEETEAQTEEKKEDAAESENKDNAEAKEPEKTVIFYVTDEVQQSQYINMFKDANLEATDEDIDAEIKDLAAQYGMEEDAVKKALSKDMLSHDIQIKKAVDLVTDSAKQVESKDAEEDK